MKKMKSEKYYTVQFSSAGFRQYANFTELDGKIVKPRLAIQYQKITDTPDLSELTTIDAILKALDESPICYNPKIYLINGLPLYYYNNGEACMEQTTEFGRKLDDLYVTEAKAFFEKCLIPFLRKHNLKFGYSWVGSLVALVKDEDGEWDNIGGELEFQFEYLCYTFVRYVEDVTLDLESEQNYPCINAVNILGRWLDEAYLTEKKLFVSPE